MKNQTTPSPDILWSPSEDTLKNSRMGQFKAWLEQQGLGPFTDYHALHQWSIDELETFWQKVWDYCGLVCDTPADKVLGKREMPGAEWFPGMKLNFAANLLRLAQGEHANREAVVAYCETRPVLRRTYAELRARSEEHTSELQSRPHLVCRLLLEKKKVAEHREC